MITKADVRAARTLYEEHCAKHKCKAQECDTRKFLWLNIGKLAMLWEKS
jgi:hypothetical protein